MAILARYHITLTFTILFTVLFISCSHGYALFALWASSSHLMGIYSPQIKTEYHKIYSLKDFELRGDVYLVQWDTFRSFDNGGTIWYLYFDKVGRLIKLIEVDYKCTVTFDQEANDRAMENWKKMLATLRGIPTSKP